MAGFLCQLNIHGSEKKPAHNVYFVKSNDYFQYRVIATDDEMLLVKLPELLMRIFIIFLYYLVLKISLFNNMIFFLFIYTSGKD